MHLLVPGARGGAFDDSAGKRVAEVAVGHLRSQVTMQRQMSQPAYQLLTGPGRVEDPGEVVATESGSMAQQVTRPDTPRQDGIGQLQLRYVLPHWRVQVEH